MANQFSVQPFSWTYLFYAFLRSMHVSFAFIEYIDIDQQTNNKSNLTVTDINFLEILASFLFLDSFAVFVQ